MCLAAKVDKERFRAKQPMGVVQEFDAAAGGPPNLRVLIGLRKCTEINAGGRATVNAVVAELVIDPSIGKAAGAIEQPTVMDHNTGSAAKRPEPIHSALETDRLSATAAGLDVERRGRSVEIVDIRLNAEDEGLQQRCQL